MDVRLPGIDGLEACRRILSMNLPGGAPVILLASAEEPSEPSEWVDGCGAAAYLASVDHTFSTQLDNWTVTNQKQTGRCWIFAGLNLLRFGVRRKMDVGQLEFSQNYTMFWDKVERANHFFECMIETADRDSDDRNVAWLLDQPMRDAGQWNMFTSLVKKYGVVPKALMPEPKARRTRRA